MSTRALVDFLAALDPKDLPADVLDRASYFLLDYLGVAIRGARAESSQPVYRMIEKLGAPGCSSVIGRKTRTLPGYAALANGAAAHAIEMDDTHNAGSIHLGVVMFPTALALAETLPDLPAENVFTAVVAGYEAAARIAMAVQVKDQYSLGFHPTSTCGVFGAAVTASKILGLSAEQTLSAVGIAGSMAAGSLEFLSEGAWTKRLHPGLAAQNGIQAALLAAEGFQGPTRILEGRDGFLHGYSRDPRPEFLTSGLGESFEILRTSVKPHACCRYMQGPIDALLDLVTRHNILPEEIRSIDVAVLEAGWPLVCEPRSQKYNPDSVVAAQFSMPFGAAVAVLDRAAGLDQFTEQNAQSDRVRQMMSKVTLSKNPQIEKTFPQEWPAFVSIETTNGAHYEASLQYPKGDPQNPLSHEELLQKFNTLTTPYVSETQRTSILEANVAHALLRAAFTLV